MTWEWGGIQLLEFLSWAINMEGLNDSRIFALWVGMAGPMKGSDCGAGPLRVRKDYVEGWLGEPGTAAL